MVQQSFVFDMTLIETFWDNWNKTGWYGADTMTPSKTDYEIIIADTSDTNQLHDIDDAIENGHYWFAKEKDLDAFSICRFAFWKYGYL